HCNHCGVEFIVRKTTREDNYFYNRWLAITIDGTREAHGHTRKEAIDRIRRKIEAGDDHDILHITDSLESQLHSMRPSWRHTIGEKLQLLDRIYRRAVANLKREQTIEANRDKLNKLRMMTVANGCTAAEEMAAKAAIEKIIMGR